MNTPPRPPSLCVLLFSALADLVASLSAAFTRPLHSFLFCLFFFVFAPLFFLPPARNSKQPLGHIEGSPHPSPLRFVPCISHREEKTSALSPLVDSRLIIGTYIPRSVLQTIDTPATFRWQERMGTNMGRRAQHVLLLQQNYRSVTVGESEETYWCCCRYSLSVDRA